MSIDTSSESPLRFDYVATVCGMLSAPSDSPANDGHQLACDCLKKLFALENPEQFPPKLFVLLASKPYHERKIAEVLLKAVYGELKKAKFSNVPLIGSTVGGVIFEQDVHEQGCLLVCLASRLIEAKVGTGRNARQSTDDAVQEFTYQIGLSASDDVNPFGNRTFFTFLPGYGLSEEITDYPAPDVHTALKQFSRGRIPIFGGVSSGKPGFQFLGCDVLCDTITGALIESGAPIAISLASGLKPTDKIICVRKVSEDQHTILEISNHGSPSDVIDAAWPVKGVVLMEEVSGPGGACVTIGRRDDDGFLRTALKTKEETVFRVALPDNNTLRETAFKSIKTARSRIHLDNPVLDFMVACTARYDYWKEQDLGRVEALAQLKNELGNHAQCVGGLFAGEAGLDQYGQSIFTNWSVAQALIGDEMRSRQPVDEGFTALAHHGPQLIGCGALDEVVRICLNLVWSTGYPGALLSLIFDDGQKHFVIAQDAIGSRFKRIVEMTRRELFGSDVLAECAILKKSVLVYDSQADDTRCNPEAVRTSGIISQYIIPLVHSDSSVLGDLQIDLGDLRDHREHPHIQELLVLKSLGNEIAAAIGGFFDREKARIARELDKTLSEALEAETIEKGVNLFICGAVKTLGANGGYVRLADETKPELVMIAGQGDYYEIRRKMRARVCAADDSSSWRVFTSGKALIVNSIARLPEERQPSVRYKNSPPMLTIYEGVLSYAMVPCRDEKGMMIGTMSFSAPKEWFFNQSMVDSLESAGRRLCMLVNAHRRRNQERQKVDFLLAVGSKLATLGGKPRDCLTNMTERFANWIGAEIAALYIWDEVMEVFVLRAQYGWNDSAWVDSARYEANEGWTGNVAAQIWPIYVADLLKFKMATCSQPASFTFQTMFGGCLPEEFTVEAIGLPLRIGPKQLGVMTFHRKIRIGEMKSGFTSKDEYVLQQAAASVSALVGAVMWEEHQNWESAENKRQGGTLQLLLKGWTGTTSSSAACAAIGLTYQATEVHFFRKDEHGTGTDILKWEAGVEIGCHEPHGFRALSKPEVVNDQIRATLDTCKVNVERIELGSVRDKNNPALLATEGLVRRAAIPLVTDDMCVGVLDVSWNAGRRHQETFITQHNSNDLLVLGRHIGAFMRQQRLLDEREAARVKAEDNRRALVAMGAMLSQSGHRLLGLLNQIGLSCDPIIRAKNDHERTVLVDELRKTVSEGIKKVKRPIDMADRVHAYKPTLLSVKSIVDGVLGDKNLVWPRQSVSLSFGVDSHLRVWVDEEHISECIFNVIQNAFDAMAKCKERTLTIMASLMEQERFVSMQVSDTGIGMSQDDIEAALGGWYSTSGRKGLGVLITSVLVDINGGKFAIKSVPGKGTSVILDLPIDRR